MVLSYHAKKEVCSGCRRGYKKLIQGVQHRVKDFFEGLCLDCMDCSKPKTGSTQTDYWKHDKLRECDWITTCRARHKRATWFYSFMGRKEDRDKFYRDKRERGEEEFQDAKSRFLAKFSLREV